MSPYHPDLALRTLALEYANLIRQTTHAQTHQGHGSSASPRQRWRLLARLRLALRGRLPARGHPAVVPRPLPQH